MKLTHETAATKGKSHRQSSSLNGLNLITALFCTIVVRLCVCVCIAWKMSKRWWNIWRTNRLSNTVYRNQFLWRLFTRFNNSSYKFAHSMRYRPALTLCATWWDASEMLNVTVRSHNEMYNIWSMAVSKSHVHKWKRTKNALAHWQWHIKWARYFQLIHTCSYTIHFEARV